MAADDKTRARLAAQIDLLRMMVEDETLDPAEELAKLERIWELLYAASYVR